MKEGLSHTSHLRVAPSDSALSQGSGDMEVLATPRMIALMENAAMLAVTPALEPGETTVLTQIDGRKLSFSLSASEGDKLIGEGTHVRFIVKREKFLGALHSSCQS